MLAFAFIFPDFGKDQVKLVIQLVLHVADAKLGEARVQSLSLSLVLLNWNSKRHALRHAKGVRARVFGEGIVLVNTG